MSEQKTLSVLSCHKDDMLAAVWLHKIPTLISSHTMSRHRPSLNTRVSNRIIARFLITIAFVLNVQKAEMGFSQQFLETGSVSTQRTIGCFTIELTCDDRYTNIVYEVEPRMRELPPFNPLSVLLYPNPSGSPQKPQGIPNLSAVEMKSKIESKALLPSHNPRNANKEKNSHIRAESTEVYCRFENGMKYKFKVAQVDDCNQCIGEHKRLFNSNPSRKEKKIKIVLAPYVIDEKSGGLGSGLVGRAGLPRSALFFQQPSSSLSIRSENEVTLDAKAGEGFEVVCALVPSGSGTDRETLVSPSFDVKNAQIFAELSDAAYRASLGAAPLKGTARIEMTPKNPLRSDFATGTLLIELDSRSIKYASEVCDVSFSVVEVIEGFPENGPNVGPKATHEVLGLIPNGYRSVLFKEKKSGIYVLSFAGTDPKSTADYLDDAWQIVPIVNPVRPNSGLVGDVMIMFPELAADMIPDLFGGSRSRVAEQYEFAVRNYEYVNGSYLYGYGGKYSNQMDQRFFVCGHSLGGGMASYVSAMHSIRGYGFNSAFLVSANQALSSDQLATSSRYFVHMRTFSDPVSGTAPLFNSKLRGGNFHVRSKSGSVDIIPSHAVSNMDFSNFLGFDFVK